MNLVSHAFRKSFSEITQIIEDLRKAEFCKDFEKYISIFKSIGWNYETDADFSEFLELDQAWLFRFGGSFLTHYGRAKNLQNYQERGKDFFSKAISIFQSFGEISAAIDTQIRLATAYWFEGGIDEAEILQSISENEFADPNGDLYLLLKVNKLAVLFQQDKINESIKLIQEISELIENCDNLQIKSQFYLESGIAYSKNGDFAKSEANLNLAVQFTKLLKIPLNEALNLNTLAMLYLRKGEYKEALKYAFESLEILRDKKYSGWIPHILDTIAQIYFELNDFENARDFIQDSVMLFRAGDDYRGRCASLFLQAKINFRLELREFALDSFFECLQIAKERLPVSFVRKFESEFLSLIYVNVGATFDEKVDFYQRYLLEEAFQQTKSVVKAAKLLGYKSSSRLSAMLKTKYPEMYREFGLNTKSWTFIKTEEIKPAKESKNFVFGFDKSQFQMLFFEIPENYNLGKFIAVSQTAKIKQRKLVVYQKNGEIEIGKLQLFQDKWMVKEFCSKSLCPVESVVFIGEIIASCKTKDIFRKLEEL